MNNNLTKYEVIIVGGGLAGLTSSILLKNAGLSVLVIEKNTYPFHRVCGEYVSNEVVSFLKKNDIFPDQLSPSQISKFEITSTNGHSSTLKLDLGGFGLSRFALDYFLFQKATGVGVQFIQEAADDIYFENDHFKVTTKNGAVFYATQVIGAYGKRSGLDRKLNRKFFFQQSPYVGVKYHIKHDHAPDTVTLHNFKNGYCGINAIENDLVNLCYLTHRANVKRYGNIAEMELKVLFENPHLKRIFTEAEFVWDKPLVINEISFETKRPVENHILMAGDSAGMITPLCGNGMAMAIHSGKIVSDNVIAYFTSHKNRKRLEQQYTQEWLGLFKNRLTVGRYIQKMFGSRWMSEVAVGLTTVKPIAKWLVKQTHGQPF